MSKIFRIGITLFVLGAGMYVYRHIGDNARNQAAAQRSMDALRGPADHGTAGFRTPPAGMRQRP